MTTNPPIPVTLANLIHRLKAVPARTILRLPTETPLIAAELMLGELCHEAAVALELLEGHHNEAHRRQRLHPSPDREGLIGKLEAASLDGLVGLHDIKRIVREHMGGHSDGRRADVGASPALSRSTAECFKCTRVGYHDDGCMNDKPSEIPVTLLHDVVEAVDDAFGEYKKRNGKYMNGGEFFGEAVEAIRPILQPYLIAPVPVSVARCADAVKRLHEHPQGHESTGYLGTAKAVLESLKQQGAQFDVRD